MNIVHMVYEFSHSFCETCQQYSKHLSDGICDDVLNHEECCFDGNDCQYQLNCTLNCPYDTRHLGDGICDLFLKDKPECCLDAGDCTEIKLPSKSVPIQKKLQ